MITTAPALERALERLAQRPGGRVGVAALHVESGERMLLNPDAAFPMASTYKVPIAVAVLALVDRGRLALREMVTVQTEDFVIGGTIGDRLRPNEVAFSVRLLLERMLIESDNSATDVLLRLAGGGPAVTAHVHAAGFAGMRVDRPTAAIIAESYDATFPDDPQERWAYFERTKLAEGLEVPADAAARYEQTDADLTTPAAMTALLERLHHRDSTLLSRESTELLLDVMARCTTGGNRLRALLPAGTPVADKTGTFGGTANDVGIITLPDGAGHLIASVYIRGATAGVAASERTIAEIARTLYDYALFVAARNA
ncbi:MAG: class A beta-lactamase [Candidatus Eremiobacteraeota bacterium]|nr:class A beta-lactamase [Candidatus Eremiobacteraeota bacterium]